MIKLPLALQKVLCIVIEQNMWKSIREHWIQIWI